MSTHFYFKYPHTAKPTGNTIKMTNSMLHYNRMNGEALEQTVLNCQSVTPLYVTIC